MPSTICDGRRKGRSYFIHYVNFFQMSTLIRLRRTAHLPGGTEGVLFFPAESGQSPMATLEPPASGAHPAIPAGEYALRLDVVSPRFARSPRRWSAAWGRDCRVWRASPAVPAFSSIPATDLPTLRVACS